MAHRLKKSGNYSVYMFWKAINYWYWLCNGTFLNLPPPIEFNDLLPPDVYTVTCDPFAKQLIIDILPVIQRPVKLLIQVTHPWNVGKMRSYSFTNLILCDYDPNNTYDIWEVYFGYYYYYKVDLDKIFISLRFIDPNTGYHTVGCINTIIVDKNNKTISNPII